MKIENFNLYSQHNTATLTTYLINEDNELAAQGARSGVLILPGGGYFNCSDREGEPVALYFASLGYHAFVLKYSTYDSGWNTKGFPDLDRPIRLNPRIAHPAPVREVGLSMKILSEHAKEWHLDMSKIAICGFSAGAHNAAMYGVYWNEPLITDYVGVPAEQIRPAAILLGYTISDCLFMKNDLKTAPPDIRKFFEASGQSFLGKRKFTNAELRDISPALLADEHFPPTFLWATAKDNLVSVQHTLLMAKALADHKVPFEVHIYEDGDHGLSLATQATAASQNMLNRRASGWTKEAAQWLEKRFAISLPSEHSFEQSVI